MRLRPQVRDLVRLYLLENAGEIRRIGEVAIVQPEPRIAFVGVLVNVIDRWVFSEDARRLMPWIS